MSTWLPPADAAVIRERAAAAERSVAAELRLALRPYLATGATTHAERAA